jgi:hypothetical protein
MHFKNWRLLSRNRGARGGKLPRDLGISMAEMEDKALPLLKAAWDPFSTRDTLDVY